MAFYLFGLSSANKDLMSLHVVFVGEERHCGVMRGASGELTWSLGQDAGIMTDTEESLKEVTFHLRHDR